LTRLEKVGTEKLPMATFAGHAAQIIAIPGAVDLR
jgi:hypothetical protein